MPTGPERRGIRGSRSALGACALAWVLSGCDGCDPSRSGGAGFGGAPSELSTASPFATPSVPPPGSEPRPGREYVDACDAEIELLSATQEPSDAADRAHLAELLLHRFELFWRPLDLQRAAALVESLPRGPGLVEQRAALASRLALLRGKLSEVLAPHSASVGSSVERTVHRAEAQLALGRCGDVLAELRVLTPDRLAPPRAGLEPRALAALGRDADADAAFTLALRNHRDPSPASLARLYSEYAAFVQARGDMARAEALYHAALERLPSYVPAALALAPMLGAQRGIALLEPFAIEGHAPELAATLALLHELRRPGSGEPWLERARKGFDAALEIAPDRYRPIAARAWLGLGVNTQEAFELAKLATRRENSPDAHVLLLDAARAADRLPEWCGIAAASTYLPDCDERGQPPASLPRCR
jgi:tetratricopeptide (TPR) repeat protein